MKRLRVLVGMRGWGEPNPQPTRVRTYNGIQRAEDVRTSSEDVRYIFGRCTTQLQISRGGRPRRGRCALALAPAAAVQTALGGEFACRDTFLEGLKHDDTEHGLSLPRQGVLESGESPLSNTPCRGSERHCSVSACFTPSRKVSRHATSPPRAVWTRARNGRWAPGPERNGCAEQDLPRISKKKGWKSAEDVYILAEDVCILAARNQTVEVRKVGCGLRSPHPLLTYPYLVGSTWRIAS